MVLGSSYVVHGLAFYFTEGFFSRCLISYLILILIVLCALYGGRAPSLSVLIERGLAPTCTISVRISVLYI